MDYSISIIIPAYNVEKTLEKSVKSLMNQTFSDWEAIIVNDGSKDNTHSITDYPLILMRTYGVMK